LIHLFSRLLRLAVLASLLLVSRKTASAAELRPESIEAFNKYIAATEARLEPRFSGKTFLWTDELPAIKQQVLTGASVSLPAQGNGTIPIKGALVQDWKAAIFVPRAALRDVLAIAQDYNRHGEIYMPEVVKATINSRQGDDFHIHVRLVKAKLMLSAVFNTEQEIQYRQLDSKRAFSRSYSRRISEVTSPGQANERELPVGRDRGFLWRMYSYWFFEERDGGVYITCESITLTRELPFGTGMILGAILRELPGEALRKSMEQTRKAFVLSH